MKPAKSALNAFTGFIAFLLSIVLVIMLIVTPLLITVTSAFSLKNIKKSLKRMELSDFIEMMDEGDIYAEDDLLKTTMESDIMQDLYELYIDVAFSALEGKDSDESISDEDIEKLVHKNIDDLYELLEDEVDELDDLSKDEAKEELEAIITDGLIEVIAELPSGEEIRSEIVADEEAESTLDVLLNLDKFAFGLIIVIVVLSGIIFVCRLSGWRGFRALSINLFIASAVNLLVCALWGTASSELENSLGDAPAQLVDFILSPIGTGLYIRTGIMVASAIAMLVAYIFMKKRSRANTTV